MELKPDYEKSIVNLTNTFLKHFNCTTYHSEFPLEGPFEGFFLDTKKIIIFIIDGMGYKKFLSLNSKLGFENVLKVSSVFPTTTVAAVTSWFTARTPREHGLLGYILYLREVGSLVNMIEHTYPGIEGNIFSSILRKRLHRLENVFDLLKEKELYGGVLTHSTIANSGLSYLIHRNGHIMSYMYM
ncbi:MAG: alkaline phosphatase family protein, partial [Fervidobacterium sp.]